VQVKARPGASKRRRVAFASKKARIMIELAKENFL